MDLYSELLWAVKRPGSRAREQSDDDSGEVKTFDSFESFLQALDDDPVCILKEFWRALTKSEANTLTMDGGYLSAPAQIGQVYQLNQSPKFGDASSDSALCTIIKNAGVLWRLVCAFYQGQISTRDSC